MRVMGVDYGDARTGVAVSDLLCSIVGRTTVIHSRNMEKTINQLCEIVKKEEVGEIAVGLPKNMDGSEGVRAELCREFAAKLEEATGMKVAMWDERRTTVTAHQYLNETNTRGKKRKDVVDEVAATIILESYLSWRKNHPDEE